jgi:monovalent cation:proton antiporter-2 (CPA2) family protein
MYGQGLFFQAFVYLSAAVVSVPIAKRLGLGSVLGYLIAGMVIGPFGFGLVGEEGQDVLHFAEFGVVMMLFLIGLELRPSLLWRLRAPILGLGGLQVGITAALIAAIGVAVSLPWGTALALGMILALSSTAIVLQTLAEKGLMGRDGGQSSFAVLLFQDIAVIPMLAIIPLLATSAGGAGAAEAAAHEEAWVQSLPAWAETLAVLGAVTAIVVGGRYFMRPIFRFIARTHMREIFTAAALLLVIGIALLMAQVGLSPALGTFLAGVDFGLIAERPGLVAGLVGALILLKFVVLFVLGRFFRMGLDQNLLFAFSLAQSGEFAFVLFSFATQHGVITANVANPLIAVVAISMAVTPLLMLLNERLVQPRFGTREREKGEADAIDEHNPVIIAGFGRFGSVVGRLLRANGVGATVLEYDSDHVELLRKLGLKVFYGDASRRDLLRSAGAEQARLLILAIDDHERTLGLVGTIKKHFPHLTLLARAAGRPEAYELLDAGVQHVYRETLDTSLRLGVDALRLLGARSYQAHRAARTFRRHDEESVVELAQMRHDQSRYLSEAKQRIHSLERILLDELHWQPDDRDAGWDTDSLREEYGGSEVADG